VGSVCPFAVNNRGQPTSGRGWSVGVLKIGGKKRAKDEERRRVKIGLLEERVGSISTEEGTPQKRSTGMDVKPVRSQPIGLQRTARST